MLSAHSSNDFPPLACLLAKCCLRHLSATIPGAVTLGTSAGMARDLLTLVANFKPGMGDWIAFVLSNQDPHAVKDPRDSYCRRHIGNGVGNNADECDRSVKRSCQNIGYLLFVDRM